MAAFTLLTIYFTATRGVILALAVGTAVAAAVYLFWAWKRPGVHQRMRWVAAAGLAFIVLSSVGLKVFSQSPLVKSSDILSRIASISLAEGTTRFTIWNMGLQGVKERPLLGWGPENYNLVFAKYFDPSLYTQEPWFDRSHNFVFDWLIAGGILGLASYLGIFAAASYVLWRAYRARRLENGIPVLSLRVAVLLSLLLFIYLFQNLFVFDQLATYLGFFAILAYVHTLARSGDETKKPRPVLSSLSSDLSRSVDPLRATGLGVAVIAVALAGYFAVYRPLVSNLALLDAYSIRSAAQVPLALEKYERALAYRSPGANEVLEQFAQFAIAVVGSPDVAQDLKEEVFTKTVRALEQGVEDNPGDPRMRLFLGAVYNQASQADQALKVFEEALALSPRKQQIMFEIADVYIRRGEYQKAEEFLKRASDLAPGFAQGSINLVAAYILNGKQAEADALLLKLDSSMNQQVLAQAYAATKNYERLLGIWQAFVEATPDNVEYRRNVAGVYLELGRPLDAIKTLEEAVAAIPSFKEEADKYIAEIKAGNF